MDNQMNGRWIDAHLHVDLYPENEREQLLDKALADGIAGIVAVSMNMASSLINEELAQKYPQLILPAYGFHPERPLPSEEETQALVQWILTQYAAGKRFAIGEVGLPYYNRNEAADAGEPFNEAPYLALLEQFVQLAAELDLPIALHAVYEDAEKTLDLLERYQVRRAHFHWFKGPETAIARMVKAGYMISITPDVLYENEIQQLVLRYPIELIMTETDGPWPFEGPFEGRQTEPRMVQQVAEMIATLKGISSTEAEAALLRNALDFYNW